MAKLRVYELARELNIESKIMVTKLKELGIDVASHQSTLTEVDAEKARTNLGGGAKPTTAKRVVVRRRRSAEPEPEKEAAPEEAPAASATPAEEKPQEPAVAAAPTAAEVEKPAATATAPEEKPEEEKKETAPRRKTFTSGAKILRRASPEEVAEAEKRKAARQQSSRPDDRNRSRPPRPGGQARPGDASASPDMMPPPMPDDPDGRRRRTPMAGEKKTTEEEDDAVKKIPLKQRKAKPLNMRDLLEQVEIEEDLLTEEPADATPAPSKAPRAAKSVYTPGAPTKKRDLKRRRDLKKTNITMPRQAYRVVKMGSEITVADFAKQMSVKGAEILKKLMGMGVMVNINANIDFDTASLIAAEYKFEVKSNVVSLEDIVGLKQKDIDAAKQAERPPVVTVMGHVDHGKTSILDAIKDSNVVSGEAGGITQHIGAYSISKNGKKITFIDTPGHEAFSAMRARGANSTDIVILVVAADDGVMPQTIEAISHAQSAGAPIVVAVNKMDKPNINIERVYSELAEHGIQSEDWGGEIQFVKCSAIEGTGLDELVDAVLLQAEILELKAAPELSAQGVVIEAHLDKGRGPVATLLVQQGTLRQGEHIVAGTKVGRVRAMTDHKGKKKNEVLPSGAVEVIGLTGVPMAGEQFNVVKDEKTARDASEWREKNRVSAAAGKSSAKSLEDLLAQVNTEDSISVPIILKADTQGSVEAIVEALEKLNTDKVKNQIIHKAVGGISESDLNLSQGTGAVVIGFNVRAQRGLDDQADKLGIIVKYFSIIYDVVDAVKSIMTGKLPPILKEVIIGHAEVRDPIKIPKIGLIAGSAVIDGKITRNSTLRLVRDEVVIYEGKLGSLRRFKDDVAEVQTGYECGIGLEGCQDIRIGDVIEAYIIEEHAASL